jgi:hypothetical protein
LFVYFLLFLTKLSEAQIIQPNDGIINKQ